jgi:hypothetical protein
MKAARSDGALSSVSGTNQDLGVREGVGHELYIAKYLACDWFLVRKL